MHIEVPIRTVRARPRYVQVPGSTLSADEMKAMWQFRSTVLPLKPETCKTADFEKFTHICRNANIAMRVFDETGKLGAIGVIDVHYGNYDGQPYRILAPEYIMSNPRFRGHAILLGGLIRSLLQTCLWPIHIPTFLGGAGYPTTGIQMHRYFAGTYIYDEADQAPLVRHVLQWIVDHIIGDDLCPVRKVVRMPTRPGPPSTGWLARAEREPFYHRYVARCPDWAEGFALPSACRIQKRRMATIPFHQARRALKRRTIT